MIERVLLLVQEAEPGDPASALKALASAAELVQEGVDDPLDCPNCGTSCISTTSPYCCEACREQSAFVRQMRRALAEGTIEDVERLRGLGQALWHVLGGGYPGRTPLILERTKSQVLKRTGGRCEICGVPAETFDNIGSG